MWRIALRMLLGDRAKYLSLVCGLAFAVLLISQQGAIFLGLLTRSTGPLQNVNQPDLWVGDPWVRWISETRNLSDADLNRVRSVPGVEWAEPFFNARATCDMPSGNIRFVNIVGVDRSTMIGRPPEVTQGRLEDLRIPDAVLVEESGRPKLENVAVGDVLKLNDKRAVVVGFCRAKPGFDSPALVYTTFENAVRFVPLGRNAISYILVRVKPGHDHATVKAAISALPDLRAFSTEEMRSRSIDFILKETGIGINFGITVLLGVVIGLAVSAAIFYQFTTENIRHYAVLKAMGASTRVLTGMVFLQAAWAGVIGFGIGVGVTSAFSLLSRRPGTELAVIFPWWIMLGAFVGMIACVSLGALMSLHRVLRLEPAMVFK
ncbi:MAG: ABC transporter permease [Phycisphaerae bacterium]|nr:ABC transporter permease [Phycisphaerae bacterium]